MVPRLARRLAGRTMTTIAALAMLACSEHVMDGPDSGDHLPPSIIDAIALDVNHVVVIFDEPVTRWSADAAKHYRITEVDGPTSSSPRVATLSDDLVYAASLHDDFRTVTLTTSAMLDAFYVVSVLDVADWDENAIVKTAMRTFQGTTIRDTTPPEVVSRLPQSELAAVSTRAFVTVGFSEAVQASTILRGLRVRGEGAQLVSIRHEDLLHFTCEVDSLQPATPYTVSLSGVQDVAGNTMPDVQWVFNTRNAYDVTAPTVVATRPANNAVNVDGSTDLSFTFSEPMDPYAVILRPPVTSGAVSWSNRGRTMTLDTEWTPGRQYTVQVRPGEMRDQAGNAGTQLFTLTFSTGDALEAGGFAGTMTGDPHSLRAQDPTGGLVFAGVTSPNDVYTSVVGMVGANHNYIIAHLRGGVYHPFYVKDTDGNRLYQPMYGDALGVYGMSDWLSTDTPLSVGVVYGTVPGIDFPVHDPTAVYGLIAYEGTNQGTVRVGIFNTDGFDPLTSVPVAGVIAEWNGTWDYVINTLNTGPIPDGEYYVAAFLDYNRNGVFDPAYDPVGVHGGATPVAIDLSHGKDAPRTNIELHEPVAVANTRALRWPDAPRSLLLDRVVAWLGEAERR